ncbi:Stealth CR1 domain-containing protein [Haemophilus haemoglobinophilus]|nr:Stealth CR1 domain-containing protein [Canicola haemoglobinophilus]
MIDFVIPWVDGSDPEWLKQKAKFDSSVKTYNNSDMRYRDWGLLRYVLRGIETNCPWYNKIYLITEGHIPSWLDLSSGKIQLITHKDLYFNKNHLPIFSSPSIEMNLAKLTQLSDKFVYMNDDFLILKPVLQERFFQNNLPVDFFCHGWLSRNKLFEKLRGMNSWAHSIKNNIDLINREFSSNKLSSEHLYSKSYSFLNKISNFLYANLYKKVLWIEHYHQPAPYLKNTLSQVRTIFSREMDVCSANRFRENTDLNQYLYRYYQLINGIFYPYKYKDHKYYKIQTKEDIQKCLNEIDKFTFVCPNDSVPDDIAEDDYHFITSSLICKLEKLLPKPSQFELKNK